MHLFRRVEQPPIGLAISPDSVRLLQVLPAMDGPPVALTALRPLPFTGGAEGLSGIRTAAEAARNMIREGGFVGRRVVAALPDDLLQIRTLRLPATPTDSAPSDEQVRGEARAAFGVELDSVHLQYLHAGKTRSGSELRHEIIAAICPTATLHAFAEALDRAGLRFMTADIAPCAIYRGVEWNCPDQSAVHAMVDLGEEQTRVLIGQGNRLRFVKSIPHGGAELRDSVARRLGITVEEASQLRRRLVEFQGDVAPEREPVRKAVRQACRSILESLANEVVHCLRYDAVSFGGARPENLSLTGAESGDPQIASVLSAATSLAAAPHDPLQHLDLTGLPRPENAASAGQWTLPLGLSIHSRPRPAFLASTHVHSFAA